MPNTISQFYFVKFDAKAFDDKPFCDWYDGAGNYSFEYKIPFDELIDDEGIALTPELRDETGLDVCLSDVPEEGTGRQRLLWSNDGSIGENWNDMAAAGIVTLDLETNINEVAVDNKVLVYPTVTSSVINITSDIVKVTFYNTLGQVAKSERVDNSTIMEVANLRKGMYIVVLEDKNNLRETTKIIVKKI